jgi:two-component SAPR family response regulator
LEVERSSVGIRLVVASTVVVDLHRFGDLVAQLRSPAPSTVAYDAAQSIDKLYAGDLLPEFYADWALLAREAVRNDYVFAMEHRLGEAMRLKDWADAIHVARRVLRVEPLLEHVHRHLMMCQLHMGDRAAAILQYRELERRLSRELDCSPMQETVRLFQSLNDKETAAAPFVSVGSVRRFAPIALQLEQAIIALAAAADALKRLDEN